MKVILNTGSTIDEGRLAKGGDKFTDDYMIECSTCWMNPMDFEEMGLPERLKVTSRSGQYSVVVRTSCDEGLQPGMIFIPRGPWANVVVDPYTFCTGSPLYKGDIVDIEPTDEKVLSAQELVDTMYME
ncbi:MAG: molybdopterin dinucleotide binding domain-containing protein [Methermicoccaceae archaeon]